jgi:small subunit ribosomal protein S6
MINYETLFILDPALEDEKKDAAIEMVKGVISADGEVGDVDVWGLKKLAYPIQKKNEGYYVVIEFQANPELPKELDRRMRISDAFMRHIIVNKEEELKNAPKAAPKAAKEEAPKAEAPKEEAPAEEAPAEAPAAEEAPVEE